ncbi:MAG TPA: hypothetical protein VG077_15760 [Verrucomicrobiae bacterium]|nr:hypothetical protein [Verrucomicrobiae bacterium]
MPAGKRLRSRLGRRGIFGQWLPAVVLFVPAGTPKFRPGQAFTIVNFISVFVCCVYSHQHEPQLLERRRLIREQVHT